MTPTTQQLLDAVRDYRIPNLDLGPDRVHPQYDGRSVLNLASTVCAVMGEPGFDPPPMAQEIIAPLGTDAKHVVVILLDALAFHRLQAWMDADDSLVWHRIADKGIMAPITSITPSTTSAVITAIWTSSPAAQHGVMGYEMWLKEYGVKSNMIAHKPITYRGYGAGLEAAGFDPETFLPVPSISGHLIEQGIQPHFYQHSAILRSGMSKTFMGDAIGHGVTSPVDLFISARETLEANPDERNFLWLYWGAIDSISHIHGPNDIRNQLELKLFSEAFEHGFLNALPPEIAKDTVVMFTADHGQITTDKLDDHYNLASHPELLKLFHMTPGGDSRIHYLYSRPGKVDAVREYIHATWPGEYTLHDSAELVEKGLFGPGDPHPNLMDRVGDIVALARKNAYWWWGGKANPLIGRHSGLSPEEMMVPFVAARLG